MPRLRDNLSHLEGKPFDLVAAFAADGIVPSFPDWSDSEFHDRRFRYLIVGWLTHRPFVRVGIRAHFCKWGNSTDFIFSVPTTLRAYRKRMRLLDRAYASGRYYSGWGQETRI